MSQAWLKAWGHGTAPCTGWAESKRHRVTFDESHNGASIEKGDVLAFYAVGRGDQVFALAEVLSKPAREQVPEEPSKPIVARVRPIAVGPVETAPSVRPILEPEVFSPSCMQAGYRRITAEQYARAIAALRGTPGCEWFD